MRHKGIGSLFMGDGGCCCCCCIFLIHFASNSGMRRLRRVRLVGFSGLVATTTHQRQVLVSARLGLTEPEAEIARIVHGQAHLVAAVRSSHAKLIVAHQVHQRLPVVFSDRHLAQPDPLAQVSSHGRTEPRDGHAVTALGTLVDVGHAHFT